MAVNVSVQNNGGFLPDIILLTQMLLPTGSPIKYQKVLSLQPMIPSKRFEIIPPPHPDWGMLRRSRCVQIFLETNLTRQCLERRLLIFLQTPDGVLLMRVFI